MVSNPPMNEIPTSLNEQREYLLTQDKLRGGNGKLRTIYLESKLMDFIFSIKANKVLFSAIVPLTA